MFCQRLLMSASVLSALMVWSATALLGQSQVTTASEPCSFTFGPESVSQGPYACQVWFSCNNETPQYDYLSVSYYCSQGPVVSNGSAYAQIGGCCGYATGSITRYDPSYLRDASNTQRCDGYFSGTYSLYAGDC